MEGQAKAPFALRNAKILLVLDLQMFPREQQDLMRSQVQTLMKESERGPSAKWTTNIADYQAEVCNAVATLLAALTRIKKILSKLGLQPIKTFQLQILGHFAASLITHFT